MGYAILTDSVSILPNEYFSTYDIIPVPLIPQNILGELHTNAPCIYTPFAAARVGTFSGRTLIKNILESGSDILFFSFSAALGGAYFLAKTMLDELRAEFPDRKLYQVDTMSASAGEGLIVLEAARMRERGFSIEMTYARISEARLRLCQWTTTNDDSNYYKSNRIDLSLASIRSAFSLKKLFRADTRGQLTPARTIAERKRSLKALVDNMEKYAIDPRGQTFAITHSGCIDDALFVKRNAEKLFGKIKECIICCAPHYSLSSEPCGEVSLFFWGESR